MPSSDYFRNAEQYFRNQGWEIHSKKVQDGIFLISGVQQNFNGEQKMAALILDKPITKVEKKHINRLLHISKNEGVNKSILMSNVFVSEEISKIASKFNINMVSTGHGNNSLSGRFDTGSSESTSVGNSDTQSSEKKNRNITLGKIVSYPIGFILIISGLGGTIESITGGMLIFTAGLISLPIIRALLKNNMNIHLTRWATITIVLIASFSGAIFLDSGTSAQINGSTDSTESIYSVGENFTEGDITYRVTEVTIDDRLFIGTSEYGTGPESELVRVRMEMANEGTQAIDVPTTGIGLSTQLTFTLVDEQDRTYDVKHHRVSSWDISPGITERALFAFEVPKDQQERHLKIGSKKVELTETQ